MKGTVFGLLLVLIAVVFGGLSGCEPVPVEDQAAPSQARIDQIVSQWLDCEECQDGELDAVIALGEDALPTLGDVFTGGPDSAGFLADNKVLVERNLRNTYQDLRASQEANPGMDSEPITEDEFVRRYMENLNARYRARAELAIQAIGGPEAEALLLVVP